MTIDNKLLIVRNDNIPTVNLDGELAMMNTEKGKYYGMNSVATRIWMLLKEPRRIREIIDTLVHEYKVEASVCEEEVNIFLEKLKNEGLIEFK
jgi:hypothetical protein